MSYSNVPVLITPRTIPNNTMQINSLTEHAVVTILWILLFTPKPLDCSFSKQGFKIFGDTAAKSELKN